MTKVKVSVLLFVAEYFDFNISVWQNANGEFRVLTADENGIDSATTNFEDVAETVTECLTEADNGECETKFCSTVFERYFEEV